MLTSVIEIKTGKLIKLFDNYINACTWVSEQTGISDVYRWDTPYLIYRHFSFASELQYRKELQAQGKTVK